MLNYPPLPLPRGEDAALAAQVNPLLGGGGVGCSCENDH